MFFEKLLEWYRLNKADLPWRGTRDPYKIWVSEIMLQQTRIEAVRPKYAAFIDRYPTVFDLANAPLSNVLKSWEGMGYYSRAKNLHKTAQIVANELHGNFPTMAAELQKLPGIGNYTSKAIASMAFGQKEICVDGNLVRVYCRLTMDDRQPKDPPLFRDAEAFFNERCASSGAGDFNQALMELGENVCLPKGDPKCLSCPLREWCRAFQTNKQTEFPVAAVKKAKPTQRMTVFVIRHGEFLALRQRPEKGLLANLYELPNVPEWLHKEKIKAMYPGSRVRYLGKHSHEFSHLIWEMQGYLVEITDQIDLEGVVWVEPKEREEGFAVPTAFKYFLDE